MHSSRTTITVTDGDGELCYSLPLLRWFEVLDTLLVCLVMNVIVDVVVTVVSVCN